MGGFRSLGEMQSFVKGLDVPEDRREVVEAELLDHFFARVAAGESEEESLAAFGEASVLRERFETVENAFEVSRAVAFRDGTRAAGGLLLTSAASWMALHSGLPYLGPGWSRFPLFSEACRATTPQVLLAAAVLSFTFAFVPHRVPTATAADRLPPDRLLFFLAAPCLAVLLALSGPWMAFLRLFSQALFGWRMDVVENVYGLVLSFVAGPGLSFLLWTWLCPGINQSFLRFFRGRRVDA